MDRIAADGRHFAGRSSAAQFPASRDRPRPPSRRFANRSISSNLLERGLELSATIERGRRVFAKQNASATHKKGIGIAAFLHGAGFTGSGERYLASVVGVEGCANGKVRVLVSSTEFGQGTKTVLCQIAAEALAVPYEDVEIAQAGHAAGAEQRSDSGFAHGDGRGQTGAIGGAGHPADADERRDMLDDDLLAGRVSRGLRKDTLPSMAN